jgi:hypothetical protein
VDTPPVGAVEQTRAVPAPGASASDSEPEVVLHGGVANAGAVVRVGSHVLRPSNPHTPQIHGALTALAAIGFDGAPVPLGVDPDGRERLEFIDGDVAMPPFPAWIQRDEALASIASLLTRFHRATAQLDLPGAGWSDEMADPVGGTTWCHNDVCLENVVFRDGRAIALLDFDFAAPGRPIYDLAQMARMCVPIDDDLSAERLGWVAADRPRRLRVVADAADLDHDGRRELLEALDGSIERGGEFVRRRVDAGDVNFVAMWEEMGGAERYDRRRRWWVENQPAFARALN